LIAKLVDDPNEMPALAHPLVPGAVLPPVPVTMQFRTVLFCPAPTVTPYAGEEHRRIHVPVVDPEIAGDEAARGVDVLIELLTASVRHLEAGRNPRSRVENPAKVKRPPDAGPGVFI
jgi:hypothetical protein